MAKFQLLNKESPERFFFYVRNGETSLALLAGEPVAYDMDGTRDGRDVSRANTAAAAKATTLFAGIPPLQIDANQSGMAQVYGFNDNLIYINQTRAASTDVWASYPAVAVGDKLRVETAGNGITRVAAGAASEFLAGIAAAQTVASATTLASSIGGTALRLTTAIKGFLRVM